MQLESDEKMRCETERMEEKGAARRKVNGNREYYLSNEIEKKKNGKWTCKECLDSGDDSDNHDDELKIERNRILAFKLFEARSCTHFAKTKASGRQKKIQPNRKTEREREKKNTEIPEQIFHQKEFKVKCPKLKLFENS